MKKIISFVMVAAMLLTLTQLSSFADGGVRIQIDNKEYTGRIIVRDNTTYVDVIDFSRAMDDSVGCYYVESAGTVYVRGDGLYLMCREGYSYIIANERYLYNPAPVFCQNGRMYAPVITLYRAFNGRIRWSDSFGGFYITRGDGYIQKGEEYYREDDVYWLSRIINAEAMGEMLKGKIAVGNVVMNRVRAEQFPSTIYSVIFDKKYGVQFTPAYNGMIYLSPNGDSIIAAKICLEYYSLSDGILYFVNPKKSPGSWASKNRAFFGSIGNHDFYY